MDIGRAPGFRREDLESRYDVAMITEDDWHAYSGCQTDWFVAQQLSSPLPFKGLLLNAGSGVYQVPVQGWREISFDLFLKPLAGRTSAVCGHIEALPFRPAAFQAAVCVGEVLAYCDPAGAIRELARVLCPGGRLILDFGSTRSVRRVLTGDYGRATDLTVEDYNGTPERTWVYDPAYIKELLRRSGFEVHMEMATHRWSALARRLGLSPGRATAIERCLAFIPFPRTWGDLRTIAAVRRIVE